MTAEEKFSSAEVLEIQELYKHFPHKSAACMEGLKVIQKHRRWVSDAAVKELGELLDMSPAAIDSIATYYNLIFRRPVGRHVVLICDSVSCWIMGYNRVRDHVCSRLGASLGATTDDGRFTLLPIVCLGACDHAPAMMVDGELHTDLDERRIDAVLAR